MWAWCEADASRATCKGVHGNSRGSVVAQVPAHCGSWRPFMAGEASRSCSGSPMSCDRRQVRPTRSALTRCSEAGASAKPAAGPGGPFNGSLGRAAAKSEAPSRRHRVARTATSPCCCGREGGCHGALAPHTERQPTYWLERPPSSVTPRIRAAGHRDYQPVTGRTGRAQLGAVKRATPPTLLANQTGRNISSRSARK